VISTHHHGVRLTSMVGPDAAQYDVSSSILVEYGTYISFDGGRSEIGLSLDVTDERCTNRNSFSSFL
jgi:hypothetical protein